MEPSRYKCDKFLLYNHERKKHQQFAKKIFCEICGKQFLTEDELQSHLNHDHERDQCEEDEDAELICHVEEQEGANKQFKCDQCLKIFKKKFNLLRHKSLAHHSKSILYAREMADVEKDSSFMKESGDATYREDILL